MTSFKNLNTIIPTVPAQDCSTQNDVPDLRQHFPTFEADSKVRRFDVQW